MKVYILLMLFILNAFICKAQYENEDNLYFKAKEIHVVKQIECKILNGSIIKLWNGDSLTFLPFSKYDEISTKKSIEEIDKISATYRVGNLDSLICYFNGIYGKKVNNHVYFKNNGYIFKSRFNLINEKNKIKLDLNPSEILTLNIVDAFYIKYIDNYYLFVLYRDEMAQGTLSHYGYGYLYVFNKRTDMICNYVFRYDFKLKNSIGIYSKNKLLSIIQLEEVNYQKGSQGKICRLYSLFSFNTLNKNIIKSKFGFNSNFFIKTCN